MVNIADESVESMDIYEIMIENINDLVSIIDQNPPFRIKFINELVFSKLLKYSNDDLINKSIIEYVHPDDKKKVIKIFSKGLDGDLDLKEIRIKNKDQKYIWLEPKVKLIEDATKKRFLLILKDKTKGKILEEKIKENELKLKKIINNLPEIRFWKLFYPKKYEEALKISYEMLQTAIDNIPENIFWKDTNLVYLGCNKNYAKLIKAENPENVIGEKDDDLLLYKILKKEKVDKLREKETYIINSNKAEYHIIEEWQLNDGNHFFLDTNRIPLLNSEAKTVGILVTYEDITDIKKKEEELEESEQKFRTISEKSQLGFFILQDHQIKYVNQVASKTLGYDINNLKKWKPEKYLQLFYPKDREIASKLANRLQEGIRSGSRNITCRCVTKSGEIMWVEIFGQTISYKGRQAALISAIDITQRKKAEEKLIESEEKYRHLFESSPNMICLLNAERKIVDFNSALLKFFGRKREELLNKNIMDIYDFSEENKELLNTKYKELFKKGYIRPIEIELAKINEKTAWISLQASFIETGLQTLIEIIMEDITDRKLSEEILQLNEARLDALFNLSQMADSTEKDIYNFAVRKAIELTNSRFGCLFILEKDEMFIKFSSVTNSINDIHKTKSEVKSYLSKLISWEEIVKNNRPIIKNNYENSIEITINNLNTQERVFRYLIIPILDEDRIVAIICVFNKKNSYNDSDIHQITSFMDGVWKYIQRKRAREALRESEKRYRDLLQTSSMGILVYDMIINDFTYTNPKFLNMLGYNKDEGFTKKDMINRIHPDDYKKFFRLLEKESLEFRIYDKEGNLKWLSGRYIFQKDENGKVISFRVWLEDVTEKKMFEELIYELNINFLSYTPDIQRNIERLLSTCAKLLNADIVIYAHKRFKEGKEVYHIMDSKNRVFDFTPEEFNKNLFISELFFENHDYVQTIFNIQDTDYAQTDLFIKEYKAKGCYGKLIKSQKEYNSAISVFYSKNPIISHQDKFVLFLVGDAIEIEQRRWQVQQHLEEQNKLKTDLLSRTSHELKTPLISIKGFTELLLTIHKDNLDTDVISILEEIKEGSNRLERLVNSLLKSFRLDQGRFELNVTTEDLSFLIRFCVKELQGLAELRNQTINLEIHEYLTCNFDKERVYEVMTNILLNAIKYTPPGGNIIIRTDIKEKFYVICVEDTGIGITEEEKLQLFKQFGKIERYGKGWDVDIEGSGLGLYNSKKIIELHQGEIWVESEGRNKGSKFYFSLPIFSKKS
ncbi:MAG: PAS domain S-box protein [Candidatus Hermodarchaeota archaeon]